MSDSARWAAVLGSPISHSLSPLLHRAAYAALGLTGWSYDAVECGVDGLATVLDSAGPDVAGFSCTMPLKREALRLATLPSQDAVDIGAGNTLLPDPAGWRAENTDWIGIRDALEEVEASPAGQRVAIIGAGGTAQAALRALLDADRVDVLVRDRARTEAIRNTADRLGRPVIIGDIREEGLTEAADVVICTLPGHAGDSLAARSWSAGQFVLDAAYDPWPSALACAVATAGGIVVSGALMLLFQAAAQVELMTGLPAPVHAMRAGLRQARPAFGV